MSLRDLRPKDPAPQWLMNIVLCCRPAALAGTRTRVVPPAGSALRDLYDMVQPGGVHSVGELEDFARLFTELEGIPRVRGDTAVLQAAAKQLYTNLKIRLGPGRVHGVFTKLAQFLQAVFIRGMETHIRGIVTAALRMDGTGAVTDAVAAELEQLRPWMSGGKLASVVKALLFAATGTTVGKKVIPANDATGTPASTKPVKVRHPRALRTVLQLPFVRALLALVRDWYNPAREDAEEEADAAAAFATRPKRARRPSEKAARASESAAAAEDGGVEDGDHAVAVGDDVRGDTDFVPSAAGAHSESGGDDDDDDDEADTAPPGGGRTWGDACAELREHPFLALNLVHRMGLYAEGHALVHAEDTLEAVDDELDRALGGDAAATSARTGNKGLAAQDDAEVEEDFDPEQLAANYEDHGDADTDDDEDGEGPCDGQCDAHAHAHHGGGHGTVHAGVKRTRADGHANLPRGHAVRAAGMRAAAAASSGLTVAERVRRIAAVITPVRTSNAYYRMRSLGPRASIRRRFVKLDDSTVGTLFPQNFIDGLPANPAQNNNLGRIFRLSAPPRGCAPSTSLYTDALSVCVPYGEDGAAAPAAPTTSTSRSSSSSMGSSKAGAAAATPAAARSRLSSSHAASVPSARPPAAPASGHSATHGRVQAGTVRQPAGQRGGPVHYSRCVGVDTGLVNIVMAYEELPFWCRRRYRKWTLTRKQWRVQTHADRRMARVRAWTAALSVEFTALAAVSHKSQRLEDLAAYCVVVTRVRRAILDETLKPRWAEEAFDRWQAGHRVLHSFWASVKAGRAEDGTAGVVPVIAYGDAKFSSTGRGRHSSPTVAVLDACVAVMGADNVKMVTEHRSSKCCADCGEPMQRVYTHTRSKRELEADARAAARATRPGAPPARPRHSRREVRGLHRCANPHCPDHARSLKDRDVNACRNILAAFHGLHAGVGVPVHMRKGVQRPGERTPDAFVLGAVAARAPAAAAAFYVPSCATLLQWMQVWAEWQVVYARWWGGLRVGQPPPQPLCPPVTL